MQRPPSRPATTTTPTAGVPVPSGDTVHLALVPTRGRLAPQRRVLMRIERNLDDLVIALVVLDPERAYIDISRQRHGAGVDSVRLRPRDLRTAIAALVEGQKLLDVGDRPAKPARPPR